MGRIHRALAMLVALLLLGAASSYWIAGRVAGRILRPPWYAARTPAQGLAPGHGGDPQQEYGLPFDVVAFATADGSTLRGWLVRAPLASRTAIVTAHGTGGDRRAYMNVLPALHAAGYPVLMFDFREHGISDGAGRGSSYGAREHEDLIAAARFIKAETGAEKVALLGSSLGATSAILAAGVSHQIDAVVAEAAGADFYDFLRALPSLSWMPDWLLHLTLQRLHAQVNTAEATRRRLAPGTLGLIKRIAPRAVFIIHGTKDDTVPVAHAHRLYAAAGQPKALWIVEGGGHRDVRDKHRAEYQQRVLAFLAAHLPLPRAATTSVVGAATQ